MPDGAAQSRAAIIRAAVDRICTRSGAEHEVPLRPPTVLSAVGPGSQITLSQEFSQENSHSLSRATCRMPNHVQTSNPNRTAQTANNLAKRQKMDPVPPRMPNADLHTMPSATNGLQMPTQQIADDGIRALSRALEMSRQREASSFEMMCELRLQLLNAYRIIAEQDARQTDTLLANSAQLHFARHSFQGETIAMTSTSLNNNATCDPLLQNAGLFSSTASTASNASTVRRTMVPSPMSCSTTDLATPSSSLSGHDMWSHQSSYYNCEQGAHASTDFSGANEDWFASSA